MIDYLFAFPDEAAALARFPRPLDEAGNPVPGDAWRVGDLHVLPIEIVYAWPTFDEEGALVTPISTSPYVWRAVAAAAVRNDLYVEDACRLEADRESRAVLRTKLAGEEIAEVIAVAPTWAGADYPFGGSA